MHKRIAGLLLFLGSSACLLCATRAAPVSGASGQAQSPAMFRANAAHTGAYTTAGLAHFHGVLWTFRTGGAVRSSPAIVGDRAYVGSSDGFLYALTSTAGHLIWRFKTGEP